MSPTQSETLRLQREMKSVRSFAAVVDLATGEKVEVADVDRFEFSKTIPAWLALHRSPGGERNGRTSGRDLLLYRPDVRETLTFGHVGEWSFDPKGHRLAWTIRTEDGAGNSVCIYDVEQRRVRVLASDRAVYQKLTWSKDGSRLAVLAGELVAGRSPERHRLVAFDNVQSDQPTSAVVFDLPAASGSRISGDPPLQWRFDNDTILLGVVPMERSQNGSDLTAEAATSDLIVWHWQDIRLPPQLKVEYALDRQFAYLAAYRLHDRHFVQLADDKLRLVLVPPRGRLAIGLDDREYARHANMTGEKFQDLYVVDLDTGNRRLAIRKLLTSAAGAERRYFYPSPDGRRLLFWQDGHFWIRDLASGQTRNLTERLPVTFVDEADDHPRDRPPIDPWGFYGGSVNRWGWSSDGNSVVLPDGWDLWRVPVEAGSPVNLTRDGRSGGLRYWRRALISEDEQGLDLSRSLLVAALDERTKAQSLVQVAPDGAGVTSLVAREGRIIGDSPFRLPVLKADDADVVLFPRESFLEPTEYYVTDARFSNPRRVTDQGAERRSIAWSNGPRLIDYVTSDRIPLQGALYLPAGYVRGRQYPLVVQVYERFADGMNQFFVPAPGLDLNPTVYTSRGYAVLRADMAPKVNDPGMAAVRSVTAAVKAAIATGIVDPKRVGLRGHSYGGFETAFIVTQTDIFAAAVASAAPTNLISYYGAMYWNSGKPNSSIYEHDQLRFDGPYTARNMAAFVRNSAVFHAENMKTPLLIMHNDKDGAVDWDQGIEYFNVLRRLGKPVIMLQYSGEGHTLEKPVNLQDFSKRMQQFFDHYLLGAPVPDWVARGVGDRQTEVARRASTP